MWVFRFRSQRHQDVSKYRPGGDGGGVEEHFRGIDLSQSLIGIQQIGLRWQFFPTIFFPSIFSTFFCFKRTNLPNGNKVDFTKWASESKVKCWLYFTTTIVIHRRRKTNQKKIGYINSYQTVKKISIRIFWRKKNNICIKIKLNKLSFKKQRKKIAQLNLQVSFWEKLSEGKIALISNWCHCKTFVPIKEKQGVELKLVIWIEVICQPKERNTSVLQVSYEMYHFIVLWWITLKLLWRIIIWQNRKAIQSESVW